MAGPGSNPEPEPEELVPPGGYYRLGEKREREPNDGRDNLLIGSILTSLGLLRAGTGAAQVYIASPGQCARLADSGIEEDSCPGLVAYGWSGVAFGGLFLATGITMLAIGASQRRKHDAWKRRYGIAFAPRFGRRAFALDLAIRF